MANLPSREYLLECFDYDKETDTLTWKKRPAEHFDSAGKYRQFISRCAGKNITNATLSLDCSYFSRSKVIFKILHGIDCNNVHTIKKGGVSITKSNSYEAEIRIGKKRFSKTFKTELEAQDWLKEMRLKFEQDRVPIVAHKKAAKSGLHGVYIRDACFFSSVPYNKKNIHLGSFKTAKEASNAFHLAKQQIKDGVFIPPNKKVSQSGFVGVYKKGNKFKAQYKKKFIGLFNTPEEAHEAYLKAKNKPVTLSFDDALKQLQKLATT